MLYSDDRHRNRAVSRAHGDEGVALVLALLFIVLLTAIVVDFNYEMQVAASSVGNYTSDLQAYLAAKSAVAAGIGMLATDLFSNEEAAALGEVEDVFDSYDDLWSDGIPLAPINDAIMQCTIDDEYGKINLNALIFSSGGDNPEDNETVFEDLAEILRYLFEYRGMEVTPVDAIIDWLDSDDEITDPDGFEYDYYESLETPYGCKNGPMDSIEELLLIPGITPEMYFGDSELGLAPLPDLLTVHGHPQGKFNINTANYEVLVAYAAYRNEPAPEEYAENVLLEIEEYGPWVSLTKLREDFSTFDSDEDDPGQNNNNNQNEPEGEGEEDTPNRADLPSGGDFPDLASSVFRIRGDGQAGDAAVRIEAYVWRDTFGNGAEQTFRVVDWRVFR